MASMLQLSALFLLVTLFSFLSNQISGMPTEVKELEKESAANEDERRATWLETRNLKDNFKELVYLSMQELASEGLLNPDAILSKQPAAEKRGRHQGFCFRKTKSGRFLPYICWKDGDQDEK